MTAATARQTLLETRLLAGRSLRHIPRIPEKLADVTIQPIIFTLLFAYVFGSAISVPGGGSYREYLIAGMFAQGMFGPVMGIAVGMAEDVRTGIVDRLRALPISRGAVLAGRALSELAQVVLGLVVFSACGLVVGWQPHGTVLETAGAYGLLVLWAFAGVWIGTFLGMVVRSAETAQTVGFTVLFPMMFLSAIFVPIGGLPAPLLQIAEYNPLSCVAGALRRLFHNPSPAVSDAWPLTHPVLATVLWSVGLIAVVAPLAVRRYRGLAAA
jgi:ABC-type polysaccharide/polyol phosphate export permease